MTRQFFRPLLVLGLGLLGSGGIGAQAGGAPAFLRVTPEEVRWSANPAMPKGVQTAVLYGDPRRAGLFALRVKFPPHTRLGVHSHPDERIRTVISGTYYSGVGDRFDASSLLPLPPGTLTYVPVKAWQFAETRDEEVVIQIIGIGPTGIDYLNPQDDPRQQK